MNFHQLSLPTPKRFAARSSLRAFPVDQIDENDGNQYIGIFTGLTVEIFNPDDVKKIHSDGCFGLSTKTKNTPVTNSAYVKNVNQSSYQQKLLWNAKFINQNPNRVMINLLPSTDVKTLEVAKLNVENSAENDNSKSTETGENHEADKNDKMEIVEEQNDLGQSLVVDPFPIEETLALLLEEAFFLHFSLRCLRIFNIDQTHEYSTEELLDKFCRIEPKFIERFVAYQYYRSKNWIVKSGLKFGGDFLLYYKGPSYYHASYVVLVSYNEDALNHLDVQSNYRVSESTNKEIILLNVTRPADLDYSKRMECLRRLSDFKISELLPKRFLLNQLSSIQ